MDWRRRKFRSESHIPRKSGVFLVKLFRKVKGLSIEDRFVAIREKVYRNHFNLLEGAKRKRRCGLAPGLLEL